MIKWDIILCKDCKCAFFFNSTFIIIEENGLR
jgi:hypothetical protein